MKASRRTFLLGALAVAAAPLGCARTGNHSLADPFTLGVASGDPAPDGVVLWTRLAPNPLADDGLGGMPLAPGQRGLGNRRRQQIPAHRAPRDQHGGGGISAQPARRTDRPAAGPRLLLPLPRWLVTVSPTGRTRTAPEPTALRPALTMCFASCSNYEHGWFTAYRSLAED